jgi:hypothetical protein
MCSPTQRIHWRLSGFIWNANAKVKKFTEFFFRDFQKFYYSTYITKLDKVTTTFFFHIKYKKLAIWMGKQIFPCHCIHILDIPHNWPAKWSRGGRHFYWTENVIFAGFCPAGNSEKEWGPIMSNFLLVTQTKPNRVKIDGFLYPNFM